MGATLYDTFLGVNDTPLASHTPNIGGPWVDDTPGWKIESNHAEQKVDSAKSHAEVSGKQMTAEFLVNTNGGSPGNTLVVKLETDAGTDFVDFSGQVGFVTMSCAAISEASAAPLQSASQLFTLSHGADHLVQIRCGPDRFQVYCDGRKVVDFPRGLAKTTALQRFSMTCGALGGSPGWVVKNLLVQGLG